MNEYEISGVKALLIKQVYSERMVDKHQKALAVAQSGIKAAESIQALVREALPAFGFDVNSPEIWKQVAAAIGYDEFKRMIALASEQIEREESEALNRQKEEPATDVSGNANAAVEAPALGVEERSESEQPPPAVGNIKDMVLARLREAGPVGSSAASIREFIERATGAKMHAKTVGMTLWRLSKDKPENVRREGRTWYYASPKNPLAINGPTEKDGLFE